MFLQIQKLGVLFACLVSLAGCQKTSPPQFRFNSVEWLKNEKLHHSNGEHFDESYKTEIGNLLTALFGTPDDPKFPYFLGDDDPAHEIITIENLKLAAGPVPSDRSAVQTGLFREHCSHCHGITGDGAGPTAASLNPYPRDFRMGKFKFKSTPLRQPPTDHDLMTILKNGIPSTAMPSFRTLPDEDREALVQYVKYLTIRGQFERYLLAEVPGAGGAPLIDMSLIASSADNEAVSEERIEEFEDQMYLLLEEVLKDSIVAKWLKPDRKVTKIPPAPLDFESSHPSHEQFVKHGQELFLSKGNCLQCHGVTGVGDGQAGNYDDWTYEWFKIANATPETYEEFMDAGALPARTILPRNLNLAIYRGGDRPDDLYLRLANGIEGTPMPASTALTSDEIWAMVAYIQSLPFKKSGQPGQDKPVNQKEIAR